MSALKTRGTYRTPLLDRVLSALERLAQDLRTDVQGLPPDLVDVYKRLVQDGLGRMVDTLSSVLSKVKERAEDDQRVYEELFVGRVALFLARQSTFLQNMSASSALSTGKSCFHR